MNIFPCILFLSFSHIGQSYDMTKITKSPKVNSTQAKSTLQVLLEFEGQKNPRLRAAVGSLRVEDVRTLCDRVLSDDEHISEIKSKKLFYHVPIKPVHGRTFPRFTEPCYVWTKQECFGDPPTPFDKRASYWYPKYSPSTKSCEDSVKFRSKREKRQTSLALTRDSITISGVDAIMLCTIHSGRKLLTSTNFNTFQMKNIAIPTNEGTRLRCVNWNLSPGGNWTKRELDSSSCKAVNKNRPSSYVDNEWGSQGEVQDIFAGIVKVESNQQKIDCVF